MDSVHSLDSLVLSLFLFLYCCNSPASPLPSLLALNCNPPPTNNTSTDNKAIEALLHNLTTQVTKTSFAISTVSLNANRFDGIMQCRLDLSPTACALCVRFAKRSISGVCPSSEAVTAWFDGCYLHYYNHYKFSRRIGIPVSTQSSQIYVMDRAKFQLALQTLLLQLRAGISLPSHLGFFNGKILYGANSSRVYALAECIRSVPLKECEVCMDKGIEKLYECCGGREGGVVVAGDCVIRFETYQFFSGQMFYAGGSDSGGWSGIVSYDESENGNGWQGLKVKVAWGWFVGVACLSGLVLGAWLLRRKVVNRAKVGIAGTENGDKVECKVVA
ncbi:PREDICTED: cysteine-rich repeat secretory protein 38-like [Nelumbo nucifera]|uniref:Cysteine-rich repeat secretory protein 38-like n=2 Tax=Nelumbo nucifera TaxID=4432 RepID=A0A1U8AQU9_NELNU|nr:PREDICTED: cysteine-rich repeat secretory protein 38-like [Nelumbo nucifera]DAD34856.1 TPA_asm: hypothetical protein HUJ06_005496 [Nelumbo nucifera]